MVIKGSAEIAGVSSINCFKKSDSVKKTMILVALVMVFGITSLVPSSDKQDQPLHSDDQKMSLQGLSDRASKHYQTFKSFKECFLVGNKLGYQLDQVIDEHGQLIEHALRVDNTEGLYDFVVDLASVQIFLPALTEGCSKETFQNYIEKFVGWHEWLVQATVQQFVHLDANASYKLAGLVALAESNLLVQFFNQPKVVYQDYIGKLIELHEQWVQKVMPLFMRVGADQVYQLAAMVAGAQHRVNLLGVVCRDHVKKVIELHERLWMAIVPSLACLSLDQAEECLAKMIEGWHGLFIGCSQSEVSFQDHVGKLIELYEQLVQAIMPLFARANPLSRWLILAGISRLHCSLAVDLNRNSAGASSGCIEKLVKVQGWVHCQEENLVKTQEWVHHQDAMKQASWSDGEVEKVIVGALCQLALFLSKQSEGICGDHVKKLIELQEQAKLMIKRLSDRCLIGDEMQRDLNKLLSELNANIDLCKKKSKKKYFFF